LNLRNLLIFIHGGRRQPVSSPCSIGCTIFADLQVGHELAQCQFVKIRGEISQQSKSGHRVDQSARA